MLSTWVPGEQFGFCRKVGPCSSLCVLLFELCFLHLEALVFMFNFPTTLVRRLIPLSPSVLPPRFLALASLLLSLRFCFQRCPTLSTLLCNLNLLCK